MKKAEPLLCSEKGKGEDANVADIAVPGGEEAASEDEGKEEEQLEAMRLAIEVGGKSSAKREKKRQSKVTSAGSVALPN